jgi:hypothetical protein
VISRQTNGNIFGFCLCNIVTLLSLSAYWHNKMFLVSFLMVIMCTFAVYFLTVLA